MNTTSLHERHQDTIHYACITMLSWFPQFQTVSMSAKMAMREWLLMEPGAVLTRTAEAMVGNLRSDFTMLSVIMADLIWSIG